MDYAKCLTDPCRYLTYPWRTQLSVKVHISPFTEETEAYTLKNLFIWKGPCFLCLALRKNLFFQSTSPGLHYHQLPLTFPIFLLSVSTNRCVTQVFLSCWFSGLLTSPSGLFTGKLLRMVYTLHDVHWV